MKKLPTTTLVSLIMFLCLLAAAASPTEVQRKLYSISTADNQLRAINPSTGATVSSITITLPGKTVFWGNGLARDPTTGKLWALLTIASQNARELVTINPVTGVATSVGNTGDNFAGLAFISNGTLYGVAGERAAVPGALYLLNTSNGSNSFVMALGHGDFGGQTIAFNPTNGLLYHASGSSKRIFESINPQTFEVTNIPLSGFASTQASGLTFSSSDGVFLMGDFAGFLFGNANFIRLTTGGFATLVGPMDHPSKGLAFVPTTAVDFDGDGKNDIGIYRDGAWFILRSSDGGVTNTGWGGPSWVPVSADYDGDGITDIAVYNPMGVWSIVRSSDGGNTVVGWGGPSWIPVPADYDGDGKADIAVYHPDGVWSIVRSSDGGNTVVGWGGPSWIPVPGDYDGDGKADIAVYKDGGWSIIRSSDGGNTVKGWGGPDWIPVPADYDGDGKTDIAVYHPAGVWSIVRSSDGVNIVMGWGGPSWTPVPADYDGDGKADIAVYHTNGSWSIIRSSDGGNTLVGWGGAPEDIPLN